MKTTNEVKSYTTFEDQRHIPIVGISSISIALPTDEACRWMESTFSITLSNWEVWTEENPDSDLIIHKPEAMEYVKEMKKSGHVFTPIERKTSTQRVAEAIFRALILLSSAILMVCAAILWATSCS